MTATTTTQARSYNFLNLAPSAHELDGAVVAVDALTNRIVKRKTERALVRGVAHHIAHHRRARATNTGARRATVVPYLAAAICSHCACRRRGGRWR